MQRVRPTTQEGVTLSNDVQLLVALRDFNCCEASLQAWLVLRLGGLPFEAHCDVIERPPHAPPLPMGRLPVLFASEWPIWDSLAISEFIAELQPGVWPHDPQARAHARSLAGEAHAGFQGLRHLLPLDLLGHFSPPGKLTRKVHTELNRLVEICDHCASHYSADGPFLFGAYSIVDAIFTPIAARIITYSLDVTGSAAAYVDNLMTWPPMIEWQELASARIEAVSAGDDPDDIPSRWIMDGNATIISQTDTRNPANQSTRSTVPTISVELEPRVVAATEKEQPSSADDPHATPEMPVDDEPDPFLQHGRMTVRAHDAPADDEDEDLDEQVVSALCLDLPDQPRARPEETEPEFRPPPPILPEPETGEEPLRRRPIKPRNLPWLRDPETEQSGHGEDGSAMNAPRPAPALPEAMPVPQNPRSGGLRRRPPERDLPAPPSPPSRPAGTDDGQPRRAATEEQPPPRERPITIQPIGAGTRRRR